MTTDFHFSPRPNRAGEISWEPWGDRAFERARREDKPILLAISAVWCHWCHVMDETTYSDTGVINAIREHYVPVRVDNDERPDVNARYNMGGWPTTAFLTPEGTVLTGATYLPPEHMLRALDEVASFYDERKPEIERKVAELRSAGVNYQLAPASALRAEIVDEFTQGICSSYDEEFAGFNEAPKFPQPEVYEFLLSQWRRTSDPKLYEIVSRSMQAMAHGGMYDHVEGGFFRYSTTRDWTVPHFEKMADDHAGLLRVLAQLYLWAPSDIVRKDLTRTLDYVRSVLRDPGTGFFAGSQDADEEYYALDLAERRRREAPFVDRRSYSNWTAALAGAFAWCGLALRERAVVDEALFTLDGMHERLRDRDGLLFHVLAPGEEPRIRGLLGDQAAYLRALLDAYEISGEPRLLERAREHADATIAALGAPDGGFVDAQVEPLGRLEVPDRPIVDNGVMAENVLRLGSILHEPAYRDVAERTLRLYGGSFRGASSFGATWVRAVARFLEPEVTVRVAGDLERNAELRRAARLLPSPFVTASSEAGPATAAYVCKGTTCAPPATDPQELSSAYASLA